MLGRPGRVVLGQARWRELETVLPWLDADPRAAADAQLLRARALLARGDFMGARAFLEPLIAGTPSALLPRVVLSHVLLREDRDRRPRSGHCATCSRSAQTTPKCAATSQSCASG